MGGERPPLPPTSAAASGCCCCSPTPRQLQRLVVRPAPGIPAQILTPFPLEQVQHAAKRARLDEGAAAAAGPSAAAPEAEEEAAEAAALRRIRENEVQVGSTGRCVADV